MATEVPAVVVSEEGELPAKASPIPSVEEDKTYELMMKAARADVQEEVIALNRRLELANNELVVERAKYRRLQQSFHKLDAEFKDLKRDREDLQFYCDKLEDDKKAYRKIMETAMDKMRDEKELLVSRNTHMVKRLAAIVPLTVAFGKQLGLDIGMMPAPNTFRLIMKLDGEYIMFWFDAGCPKFFICNIPFFGATTNPVINFNWNNTDASRAYMEKCNETIAAYCNNVFSKGTKAMPDIPAMKKLLERVYDDSRKALKMIEN